MRRGSECQDRVASCREMSLNVVSSRYSNDKGEEFPFWRSIPSEPQNHGSMHEKMIIPAVDRCLSGLEENKETFAKQALRPYHRSE